MNTKKGATSVLELLVISGILLFFIMAPIAYYNLITTNMTVMSVYNTTLQAAAMRGGYDANVERMLYENLAARGMLQASGDLTAVIAADKAKAEGERQVLVSCTSNQVDGDLPIYRAYALGDDSGIQLTVSVLQKRQWAFLGAISGLIGMSRDYGGRYLTADGYVMSQCPRPVS